MNYPQPNYGKINELGMLTIPKNIQEASKFKPFDSIRGVATLVKCTIEDGCIVLRYYDELTLEELKAREDEDGYEVIKAIDELGRIFLIEEFRERLEISAEDLLSVELADDKILLVYK